MAKFFAGKALSKKIKQICAGNEVCCAVAFWGDGAKNGLFGAKSDSYRKARIICDLTMGGTNPAELEALGSPRTRKIRHISGLHTKIYLSERGVIVASANASDNGIGFSTNHPRLDEAGSFSKADSAFWKEAQEWFEDKWKDAKKVTRSDLDEAKRRWVQRENTERISNLGKKFNGKMSVIEALREIPEIFGQMKFALSYSENDKGEVAEAKEKFEEEKGISLRGRKEFEGWGLKKNEWPIEFIHIHQGPRGGLWISFLQRGDIQVTENSDVHFAPSADLYRDKPDLAQYLDLSIGKYLRRNKDELPKGFIEKIRENQKETFFTASKISNQLRSHKP